MRHIGNLSNENQAHRLSAYLKNKRIENRFEGFFDAQTGHMSYQLWVHDEDQLEEASDAFRRFEKAPSDPEFDVPILEQIQEESSEKEEASVPPPLPFFSHRFSTHLTTFLLTLCAFIFFLNLMEEYPMRQEGLSEKTFLMTPIQALLLYDLPAPMDELEQVIEKNKIKPGQKIDELPPVVKAQLDAVNQSPYWRGFYDWVLLKIKKQDSSLAEGPLFTKIREGEVWRLFSPCILHQDLLHILFNMIWLWVLGRPIEQRIGPFRTLLLTLVCGIGSNTIQYLMTGPFFIGYSGVVMGLAGFIWMREKVAPWEGYPLNRATVLFLLLFIGAIFAIQVLSFFIQIFTDLHFAPNIANTAHIAGALIGALLGRSPYFAQRVKP